jgi:DNA-binding transcriptional ArsR family regulator
VELPPGTVALTRPAALDAVASPVRQEILERLRHAGAASVADLARLTGRSPTALHYHVALLRRAGLLRPAGRRPAGKGSEALYRLAAARFAVVGDRRTGRGLGAAARTLAATLRLAQREGTRAIHDGRAAGSGPGRRLHARRHSARLSPAALARVNRLIEAIERVFSRELDREARARRLGRRRRAGDEDAGRMVALTLLLAPSGRVPGRPHPGPAPRRRRKGAS